jgi:hypothetical protein
MAIKSGTRFVKNGETHTVKSVDRTFETETPRYSGDSNPIPAGSITVRHDCRCGIIRETLRPGTFETV